MIKEDNELGVKVSLPAEWAVKDTLGPTLKAIGIDLESLYQYAKKGTAKLFVAANMKLKKSKKPVDGQTTNLRVARDVIMNAPYSDDEVSAEYFAGLLIESRSEDGKDDSAMYYLDIIKSMSAKQILLHYLVYSSINKLTTKNQVAQGLNMHQSGELGNLAIAVSTLEIGMSGIRKDIDYNAIYSKGLISAYEYKTDKDEQGNEYNVSIFYPTILGIQLYAAASSELDNWDKFNKQEIGNFELRRSLTNYDLLSNGMDFMKSLHIEPVKV